MKTFNEVSLRNFEFWSGAIDNANSLTMEQLDEIELILEDLYPDGIDCTVLNDIFRFDFDWILSCLGLNNDDESDD